MKQVNTIQWLIALTTLLAACVPQSAPSAHMGFGPKSWIDTPLDGIALPPNLPVQVTSHSADPLHIAQIELSVNGQVVQTAPSGYTGQTLVLTSQQWSPPGAGNYTLMVRAQNSAGAWGEYAQAVVTILGAETPTQVAPRPLVVPSATAVSKSGAATPSPFPAATVAFYADVTLLTPGQCTTIHWQAKNVSQVALDNVAVNPSGTKQDCPSQTAAHVLRVVTLDGQTVQRTLTLTVTTPSRTPVPPVTRTTAPLPTGCSGSPIIAFFVASPPAIPLGGSANLSWGAVTNADSVEIDNRIGGVAAPGSMSVSPNVTTVYVLTAKCKGVSATARALVTVLQPPTRTPTLIPRRLPWVTPTQTRVIIH